jgi:hypothetical protein
MRADLDLRGKSLLERHQDALNELAHLVEDCDNRLSLETLDLAKRYIEGRLQIYLKIRARDCGCDFHIIVGRVGRQNRPFDVRGDVWRAGASPFFGLVVEYFDRACGPHGPAENDLGRRPLLESRSLRDIGLHQIAICASDEVPSSARTQGQKRPSINAELVHGDDGLEIDWHEAGAMFVGFVDCINGAQERVSLLSKGLELPEHVMCIDNTISGAMLVDCDGAQHLVERSSNVVKDRSHGEIEVGRNLWPSEAPDLNAIRIDLGCDFMQATAWAKEVVRSAPRRCAALSPSAPFDMLQMTIAPSSIRRRNVMVLLGCGWPRSLRVTRRLESGLVVKNIMRLSTGNNLRPQLETGLPSIFHARARFPDFEGLEK